MLRKSNEIPFPVVVRYAGMEWNRKIPFPVIVREWNGIESFPVEGTPGNGIGVPSTLPLYRKGTGMESGNGIDRLVQGTVRL